jgi:hypothetical protein
MRRVLALVVAAVLVNLPWAHEAWVDHRIDSSGRDVHATLVAHRDVGDRHFVSFRLPADVDPAKRTFSARLDRRHYDAAVAAGTVEVRVVPSHPTYNRPAGEVGGDVFLVAAVVGDLVLLGVAAMMWWRALYIRRGIVKTLDKS